VKAPKKGNPIRKSEMASTIRRMRGSLKRTPSDKSFSEEWAESKAQEKALEEA
jgi:hypothetical protein